MAFASLAAMGMYLRINPQLAQHLITTKLANRPLDCTIYPDAEILQEWLDQSSELEVASLIEIACIIVATAKGNN